MPRQLVTVAVLPSASNPTVDYEVKCDGERLTCPCPRWTNRTHYAACTEVSGDGSCNCKTIETHLVSARRPHQLKVSRTCKHIRQVDEDIRQRYADLTLDDVYRRAQVGRIQLQWPRARSAPDRSPITAPRVTNTRPPERPMPRRSAARELAADERALLAAEEERRRLMARAAIRRPVTPVVRERPRPTAPTGRAIRIRDDDE